jgi:type VI secretion system protein ImpG
MEQDDALYKHFLEELESLEKFRMGYTAQYTAAPLGREDQDVRRLIEAMAVFSARTRLAGQRTIARGTLRLFQQYFPYVLSPQPAMAMLQAVIPPDHRFVNATRLPRGTRVLLSPPRDSGSAPPLTFSTLAPLHLQPLRLKEVRTERGQEQDTPHLLLEFVSDSPRRDVLEALPLYVNHLNDFLSSLKVHYQLKQDLAVNQAQAFFGPPGTPQREAVPCEVSFVRPPCPLIELEPFEHPLQRLRTFFHFPQQELFLELRLPKPPKPPKQGWQHLTIRLDLKNPWPKELLLKPDSFVPHAVPMVNLQRTMSVPLEHDGTKERQGLQHPEPGGGYRVHSVVSVNRMGERGFQPLRPGVLSGARETYELEHEGTGPARRTWLSLHLPGAFSKPVSVAVDACWHQPLSAEFDSSRYRTGLAERHIEGVTWNTLGPVLPGADNSLEQSPQKLLRLLSIRNQRFLGLEDLLFLLEALGARDSRYFRPVVERLSKVEHRKRPSARSATGLKYTYHLTFAGLDPALEATADLFEATVDLFSARLLELLRDWSTEEVVELEVSLPHAEQPLRYPSEAPHE